jgi:hypothetical protein
VRRRLWKRGLPFMGSVWPQCGNGEHFRPEVRPRFGSSWRRSSIRNNGEIVLIIACTESVFDPVDVYGTLFA